jgi:predicted enzyme involved in methoxymalonyl-ACP biosynthesis
MSGNAKIAIPGVERQMLFELAKAQGATIKGMLGRYVESAKNAPCKDLYKSCGFDQVSQTEWSFSLGENRAIKAVPWISVKH